MRVVHIIHGWPGAGYGNLVMSHATHPCKITSLWFSCLGLAGQAGNEVQWVDDITDWAGLNWPELVTWQTRDGSTVSSFIRSHGVGPMTHGWCWHDCLVMEHTCTFDPSGVLMTMYRVVGFL